LRAKINLYHLFWIRIFIQSSIAKKKSPSAEKADGPFSVTIGDGENPSPSGEAKIGEM
jgi:hypothetical protein